MIHIPFFLRRDQLKMLIHYPKNVKEQIPFEFDCDNNTKLVSYADALVNSKTWVQSFCDAKKISYFMHLFGMV